MGELELYQNTVTGFWSHEKTSKRLKKKKLKTEGWQTNRKYKKAPRHYFYMKMFVRMFLTCEFMSFILLAQTDPVEHFPSFDEFNPVRCFQCFVIFL